MRHPMLALAVALSAATVSAAPPVVRKGGVERRTNSDPVRRTHETKPSDATRDDHSAQELSALHGAQGESEQRPLLRKVAERIAGGEHVPFVRTRPTGVRPLEPTVDLGGLERGKRLGEGWMKVAYDAGDKVLIFPKVEGGVARLRAQAEILGQLRDLGLPATRLEVGTWRGEPAAADTKYLGGFSKDPIDPKFVTARVIDQLKAVRDRLKETGAAVNDLQWAVYPRFDGDREGEVRITDPNELFADRKAPFTRLVNAMNVHMLDQYIDHAETAGGLKPARTPLEKLVRRFYAPGGDYKPFVQGEGLHPTAKDAIDAFDQHMSDAQVQRLEARLVVAPVWQLDSGGKHAIQHAEWQIYGEGKDGQSYLMTRVAGTVPGSGAGNEIPGYVTSEAPGVEVTKVVDHLRSDQIHDMIKYAYRFKGPYLKGGWVCQQVAAKAGAAIGVAPWETAKLVKGFAVTRVVLGTTGVKQDWSR